MSKKAELVVLATGLICLILFAALPLFFPDPETIKWGYIKQARIAAGVFYGATASDLGQDIVGMRALWSGKDAYPLLGPAMEDLGLHWDLDFHSPHPPTSFLFAAPVAFFPWAKASLLWAISMIVCWIFALRLLALNWNLSIGIGGLLLLWPPAALSLGQLTAPMLLFLMIAYAWRERKFSFSGTAIGVAAMAKYTPLIALINFASTPKRWRAVAGFAFAWLLVLGFIFVINPYAITRYFEINQANSMDIFHRVENASPFAIGWRAFGWPGVAGWLAFLGFAAFANRHAIRANSTRGWMVTFYLSVALLPVMWIYSLLLLLPVVWFLFTHTKNRLSQTLAAFGLALTFLSPAFGTAAIPFVSGSVALFGLALFPQSS